MIPTFGVLGTIVFICVVTLGLWGCPQYNVYEQRLDGEARLAKAEYERQVQVRDAQGRLDASGRLAEAEVRRAEGVAKANKIIGESLKENEAYLKYLWINEISSNQKAPTVIYVPTEANLPIMEATRLKK